MDSMHELIPAPAPFSAELIRQIALRILDASGAPGVTSQPQWVAYSELAALVHWFWLDVQLVRFNDFHRFQDLVELADMLREAKEI